MSDSFTTLWTVALQAPLSMGFSRQEHWSGLPCPLPGDLPDPGIQPASLRSPEQVGSLSLALPGKPLNSDHNPSDKSTIAVNILETMLKILLLLKAKASKNQNLTRGSVASYSLPPQDTGPVLHSPRSRGKVRDSSCPKRCHTETTSLLHINGGNDT